MTSARYCPCHRLVLEETLAGLICPMGHNWVDQHTQDQEYWVVDMEFTAEDDEFVIWIVKNGSPQQGPYYARRAEAELDITCGADYLHKPEHWARNRKHKKQEMSFLERAFRGRI